jgi:hypothetical protein
MNNSNPIVVTCRVRGELQMHAKLMIASKPLYLGTVSEIRRLDGSRACQPFARRHGRGVCSQSFA